MQVKIYSTPISILLVLLVVWLGGYCNATAQICNLDYQTPIFGSIRIVSDITYGRAYNQFSSSSPIEGASYLNGMSVPAVYTTDGCDSLVGFSYIEGLASSLQMSVIVADEVVNSSLGCTFPLVVLMRGHSEGYRDAKSRKLLELGAMLAKRGYVVAIISTRRGHKDLNVEIPHPLPSDTLNDMEDLFAYYTKECSDFFREGIGAVGKLSYDVNVYRSYQDAHTAIRYLLQEYRMPDSGKALPIAASDIFVGGFDVGASKMMALVFMKPADFGPVIWKHLENDLLLDCTNPLQSQVCNLYENLVYWDGSLQSYIPDSAATSQWLKKFVSLTPAEHENTAKDSIITYWNTHGFEMSVRGFFSVNGGSFYDNVITANEAQNVPYIGISSARDSVHTGIHILSSSVDSCSANCLLFQNDRIIAGRYAAVQAPSVLYVVQNSKSLIPCFEPDAILLEADKNIMPDTSFHYSIFSATPYVDTCFARSTYAANLIVENFSSILNGQFGGNTKTRLYQWTASSVESELTQLMCTEVPEISPSVLHQVPQQLADVVQDNSYSSIVEPIVLQYPQGTYYIQTTDKIISTTNPTGNIFSSLRCYPNPVSAQLIVKPAWSNTSGDIQIWNALGQQVALVRYTNSSSPIMIDTHLWKNGVYFVAQNAAPNRYLVRVVVAH